MGDGEKGRTVGSGLVLGYKSKFSFLSSFLPLPITDVASSDRTSLVPVNGNLLVNLCLLGRSLKDLEKMNSNSYPHLVLI